MKRKPYYFKPYSDNRSRHGGSTAAVNSYTARRARSGDGFEVADTSGRIVAQAFDTIEEAQAWAAENQPRQPG